MTTRPLRVLAQPSAQGAQERRRTASGLEPGRRVRVLVVDDDPALRELIATVVECAGHEPLRAAGVTEALVVLEREAVDLVLSDLNMPGLGGLDLLAALSARARRPPVIVVSGSADAATLRAARLLGARAVLEKPFAFQELASAVEDALVPEPVAEGARVARAMSR